MPDHEPLVADPRPVAVLGEDLVEQARTLYHERFEVGRDAPDRLAGGEGR